MQWSRLPKGLAVMRRGSLGFALSDEVGTGSGSRLRIQASPIHLHQPQAHTPSETWSRCLSICRPTLSGSVLLARVGYKDVMQPPLSLSPPLPQPLPLSISHPLPSPLPLPPLSPPPLQMASTGVAVARQKIRATAFRDQL